MRTFSENERRTRRSAARRIDTRQIVAQVGAYHGAHLDTNPSGQERRLDPSDSRQMSDVRQPPAT